MATLVLDPDMEKQLLAERSQFDGSQYDEVREGVHVIMPLYRHENGQLIKVGQSTLATPDVIESRTVGLTFQLLPGEPRPQIQARHTASGRQWMI